MLTIPDEYDFQRTGGTLIVRSPVPTEHGYNEYKATIAPGAAPLSFEDWQQDCYAEFLERLLDRVEDACKDLGLDVGHFEIPEASFDSEFSFIGRQRMTDVGWLPWGRDHLIGVGCAQARNWQDSIADPTSNPTPILMNTARPPVAFADLVKDHNTKALTFLRLSLIAGGYTCELGAGKLSQVDDSTPRERDSSINRLRGSIHGMHEEIYSEAAAVLPDMKPHDRIEVIKAHYQHWVDEGGIDFNAFRLQVPLYCHERKSLLWVAPLSGQVFKETEPEVLGENIEAMLRNEHQVNGLSVVPRNEITATFFNDYQRRIQVGAGINGLPFVISAEEFAAASEKPFAVCYEPTLSSIHDVLNDGLALARDRLPTMREDILTEAAQNLAIRAGAGKLRSLAPALQAVVTLATKTVPQDDKRSLYELIDAAIESPVASIPKIEISMASQQQYQPRRRAM